jgi:hypothetical protein
VRCGRSFRYFRVTTEGIRAGRIRYVRRKLVRINCPDCGQQVDIQTDQNAWGQVPAHDLSGKEEDHEQVRRVVDGAETPGLR